MARTRRGSAALRTAAFSALQPGPRLSRQRDVRPGDALLPGSSGSRAALFAGPPSAGHPPPHGQLKQPRSPPFVISCPLFAIVSCLYRRAGILAGSFVFVGAQHRCALFLPPHITPPFL